ncbi:viroplasmin family protein [Sporomusa malonica]|uniref:ribonuclease H n=1 Tax=Sporomusa malonica TaxID=112901 RepID=A0A1W2CSN5_9FIRM|nr:ribonuclease H family protein [Sporomusa malonica]SMC88257.1 ribonuclease HI [Sporomusa malonica]
MTKQKYYGVKVGRKVGVYKTWSECQKQVIGYPGALFKSFLSELEAREYINGVTAAMSTTVTINANDKHTGNHYDIYVDGSYDNSKKKYSWGFAVYQGSEVIHTASGIGENAEATATRNVAGELEATMKAVLWAEMQDIDSITIHHDYIGISEWATGKWKTNNTTTQGYACFIRPYLTWVSFNKVAGHTGIPGNELADKLAGEVLKQA